MGEGVHRGGAQLAARFRDALGGVVHAAHQRQNPDFIPDAHLTVFPFVAHEGSFKGLGPVDGLGLVGVVLFAAQGRFQVVGMNPFPSLNVALGGADGAAVLDHLFAFGDRPQGDFVPGGNALPGGDQHAYVIQFVELDVIAHVLLHLVTNYQAGGYYPPLHRISSNS
jgi:hypothetical protein